MIRDARDNNAEVVDAAVQSESSGYRLPTSMEGKITARWKDDTSSTDGSIERGGRWWTPGNYTSGATAPYTDASATGAVSWYVCGKLQPRTGLENDSSQWLATPLS